MWILRVSTRIRYSALIRHDPPMRPLIRVVWRLAAAATAPSAELPIEANDCTAMPESPAPPSSPPVVGRKRVSTDYDLERSLKSLSESLSLSLSLSLSFSLSPSSSPPLLQQLADLAELRDEGTKSERALTERTDSRGHPRHGDAHAALAVALADGRRLERRGVKVDSDRKGNAELVEARVALADGGAGHVDLGWVGGVGMGRGS